MQNTDIDIHQDSWKVRLISRRSGESKPVGVVGDTNEKFSLTIIGAWDRANSQLQEFLNEYDIEQKLGLQNCIDN